MKLGLIRIAKCLFRLCYLPFRLLKPQPKTVFLSRQADTPNLDFLLLAGEIRKQNSAMTTVMLCKRLPAGVFGKLTYLAHLLVCMYHLATATHCVVDSYSIPVSLLPHKNLRIMQIWHALCAVKQFGYQTLDRQAGSSRAMATAMEMHRNYHLVLAPSGCVARHFSAGFGVSLSCIHLLGMPRIDYILTPDPQMQSRLMQAYPALLDKPNILYTPTFRKGSAIDLTAICTAFDFSHYNLVIKHHALDETAEQAQLPIRQKAITITDDSFSVFDLYKVCDSMITDYSATALEFSLLQKPLYFYVYDYDAYAIDPGLNIDVRAEFPAYTSSNFEAIMQMIQRGTYDFTSLQQFRTRYITAPTDCTCTEKIVALLLQKVGSAPT